MRMGLWWQTIEDGKGSAWYYSTSVERSPPVDSLFLLPISAANINRLAFYRLSTTHFCQIEETSIMVTTGDLKVLFQVIMAANRHVFCTAKITRVLIATTFLLQPGNKLNN